MVHIFAFSIEGWFTIVDKRYYEFEKNLFSPFEMLIIFNSLCIIVSVNILY